MVSIVAYLIIRTDLFTNNSISKTIVRASNTGLAVMILFMFQASISKDFSLSWKMTVLSFLALVIAVSFWYFMDASYPKKKENQMRRAGIILLWKNLIILCFPILFLTSFGVLYLGSPNEGNDSGIVIGMYALTLAAIALFPAWQYLLKREEFVKKSSLVNFYAWTCANGIIYLLFNIFITIPAILNFQMS